LKANWLLFTTFFNIKHFVYSACLRISYHSQNTHRVLPQKYFYEDKFYILGVETEISYTE